MGGERFLPREILDHGRVYSDAYGTAFDAPDEGVVTPPMRFASLWFSRDVMADLNGDGRAAFVDTSGGPMSALERVGWAVHSVKVSPYGRTDGAKQLLPVLRADADRPSSGRYWLATYEHFPLVVRAERPRDVIRLLGVMSAPTTPGR